MKSTDLFNHIRNTTGTLTQSQVDAAYRILKKVDIKDLAEFIGVEVNIDVNEGTNVVNDLNKNDVGINNFKFSERSLLRMDGVNKNLVNVIKEALPLSKYDFGIIEGMRTLQKQQDNVKKGVSQTLKSNHLLGRAIDVMAFDEKGVLTWDWEYYLEIAEAVRKSAIENNVKIRWGSAWGRYLNDYPSARAAYDAYIKERKQKGLKPFIDAVHFEM